MAKGELMRAPIGFPSGNAAAQSGFFLLALGLSRKLCLVA
jgi:hypothetical protein